MEGRNEQTKGRSSIPSESKILCLIGLVLRLSREISSRRDYGLPIVLNTLRTAVLDSNFDCISLSPITLDAIIVIQKTMYGNAESKPFLTAQIKSRHLGFFRKGERPTDLISNFKTSFM
jgi:hypothetical protein